MDWRSELEKNLKDDTEFANPLIIDQQQKILAQKLFKNVTNNSNSNINVNNIEFNNPTINNSSIGSASSSNSNKSNVLVDATTGGGLYKKNLNDMNFITIRHQQRQQQHQEINKQQQMIRKFGYLESGSGSNQMADDSGIDSGSDQSKKQLEDAKLPLCFQSKRHQSTIEGIQCETQSWRIRERMKTVSVALVLCLNIGVDPPDVIKIQPCARLECWIDPSSVSPTKALELISSNLQKQYERWQPRARYKKSNDPTVDEVKKLCTSLRRNAKEERVLFHYNGHGVPKPTSNGEIWVFNKTYTQYIPLSIYDLQSWMGAPSIYVYDCSNAGMIIQSFNQFAEQHEREMEKAIGSSASTSMITYKNCIQLAACSANQILPMNAQLPADLFTSCLTTPIKTALKWHTMQKKFGISASAQINNDLIDKIPGLLNDRRTMLGELNWIFTAITDTIAWNTLPRDLFQKLFRQDLLVASLFRNFLLSERILRSHDCTPVSSPELPQCFRHPMWLAWDLAVDLALQQLPDILENGAVYEQLPFFEEQLTAFQVWLDRESDERSPPEQLPIVLQVLLSQVHRMRALELLGRFLDLGPWAVNLALGVGIFPYVLKLLQSSAKELRPILVFIWAKILAVDSTCQIDLVKDHKYFLSVLQDATISKEHRTLSAFVLASIVNNFLLGQTSALQGSLVSICLDQLYDESWLLRQWLAICLGQLWQNFAKARWSGVRDMAHEKLYPLLTDPVPEVRAASVFALGTYISSVTERSEHANNIDRYIAMTLLTTVGEDISPLVRLELIAALQWMVVLFETQFVTVYLQETATNPQQPQSGSSLQYYHNPNTHSLERTPNMRRGYSSSCIPLMMSSSPPTGTTIGIGSIYMKLWQGITNLGRDPYPPVSDIARKAIEYVRNAAVSLLAAKEATNEKYTTSPTSNSSLSLPPSPNTRTSYLGESPPIVNNSQQINVMSNSATAVMVSGSCTKSGIVAPQQLGRPRSSICSARQRTASMNEEESNSSGPFNPNNEVQQLKPIVTTNFIPWAISYFASPDNTRCCLSPDSVDTGSSTIFPNSPKLDLYSKDYRQRYWRFKRNEQIRKTAKEQQLRAIFNRIDTQTWIGKTQFTPSLVKLLPYENQIAVAYKEKVSVHDWSKNIVYSYVPPPTGPSLNLNNIVIGSSVTSKHQKSYSISSSVAPVASVASVAGTTHGTSLSNNQVGNSSNARVTSMEFINSHDVALILVAYEDGTIRVWQEPPTGSKETKIISAWQGLPLSSKTNKDMNGVVTTWLQRSQHLIVSGYTKSLRIWDIERELKLCDLPTNSDSYVRVLHSAPNELVAAGCSDGSVRLFDKRLPPSEARIMSYREHSDAILTACLRDNCESLVSGCKQGKIRLFDLRNSSSVQNWSVGNDVTAIAVHSGADIVACGAQYISIYGLDGRQQTTLRSSSYEGFMGSRQGQSICLSFHPHKVDLSAGFVDNTVAVYSSSGNNKNN